MPETASIQFDTVADIYDQYVTADFDVAFFVEEARSRGKVLELTSGTGRLSIPLLQAGVDLTCVDYSPKMLEQLRKKLEHKNLSCPVVEMDISELSLHKQYSLILIPFNSFAEILDPGKQRSALMRIREHLKDDGEFICTLHNSAIRVRSLDGVRHKLVNFHREEIVGSS